MAGRPTGPCTRSQTARYGRVRPVRAVYTVRSQPVHGSVYGRYTAVRHVHTSTPQLKGRVRAMYTSVYTASTPSCTWQVSLHGRVHGPRRHVTAVGRGARSAMYTVVYTSHTQPCTCSSTRPRTRTVCRNGPHTAVACRLGNVYTARPDRPTCRIHGRDGPCTRAVTRPCTRYVDGRKRQCTRPVYMVENGRAHGAYTPVYTSRYGPYRAVYTTRYTAVYTAVFGHVDGPYTAVSRPLYT